MAFKIYKKNNYIIVEDTISGKQYQGLAKNVFVYKDTITEATYDFEGLTYNGLKGVSLSDIIDENNTTFANEQAFIDFYTTNTGNFNLGGGSPQDLEGYATEEWVLANTPVDAPFLGSIIPTDTPTGTGDAYWLATQSGTYTNFGNKVVSANSLAVISRNQAGAFSISQTAFVIPTPTDVKEHYKSTLDKLSTFQNRNILGTVPDEDGILTNGTVGANASFKTTGFMFVVNGSYFFLDNGVPMLTSEVRFSLFTSAGVFVKTLSYNQTTGEVIVDNVGLLRFSRYITAAKPDHLRTFSYGTPLTAWQEKNIVVLTNENTDLDIAISPEQTEFFETSVNILNPADVLIDTVLTNGVEGYHAVFSTTAFLKVPKGQTQITLSRNGVAYNNATVSFYDRNKVWIKNGTIGTGAGIAIDKKAKYVRFCIGQYKTYNGVGFKIEFGAVTTAYSVYYPARLKSKYRTEKTYLSEGTTIAYVGDSFTQDTTYVTECNRIIKPAGFYNWGVSGRMLRDLKDELITRFGALTQPQKDAIKVISIFAGTNDFTFSFPFGNINSPSDRNSFYGSVKYLCDHILATPDLQIKQIVFVTPVQRYGAVSPTIGVTTDTDANGIHITKYATAIKEVAAIYGFPVLDLCTQLGVNKSNVNVFTVDGIHLVPSKYVQIGRLLANKIEEWYL